MKNTIKLRTILRIAVIVCIAALVLASCGPRGGVIEVTNNYRVSLLGVESGVDVTVSINKELKEVVSNTTIKAGATKKFSFDEDGIYTVTSLLPPVVELATLFGGNTVKITIDEK